MDYVVNGLYTLIDSFSPNDKSSLPLFSFIFPGCKIRELIEHNIKMYTSTYAYQNETGEYTDKMTSTFRKIPLESIKENLQVTISDSGYYGCNTCYRPNDLLLKTTYDDTRQNGKPSYDDKTIFKNDKKQETSNITIYADNKNNKQNGSSYCDGKTIYTYTNNQEEPIDAFLTLYSVDEDSSPQNSPTDEHVSKSNDIKQSNVDSILNVLISEEDSEGSEYDDSVSSEGSVSPVNELPLLYELQRTIQQPHRQSSTESSDDNNQYVIKHCDGKRRKKKVQKTADTTLVVRSNSNVLSNLNVVPLKAEEKIVDVESNDDHCFGNQNLTTDNLKIDNYILYLQHSLFKPCNKRLPMDESNGLPLNQNSLNSLSSNDILLENNKDDYYHRLYNEESLRMIEKSRASSLSLTNCFFPREYFTHQNLIFSDFDNNKGTLIKTMNYYNNFLWNAINIIMIIWNTINANLNIVNIISHNMFLGNAFYTNTLIWNLINTIVTIWNAINTKMHAWNTIDIKMITWSDINNNTASEKTINSSFPERCQLDPQVIAINTNMTPLKGIRTTRNGNNTQNQITSFNIPSITRNCNSDLKIITWKSTNAESTSRNVDTASNNVTTNTSAGTLKNDISAGNGISNSAVMIYSLNNKMNKIVRQTFAFTQNISYASNIKNLTHKNSDMIQTYNGNMFHQINGSTKIVYENLATPTENHIKINSLSALMKLMNINSTELCIKSTYKNNLNGIYLNMIKNKIKIIVKENSSKRSTGMNRSNTSKSMNLPNTKRNALNLYSKIMKNNYVNDFKGVDNTKMVINERIQKAINVFVELIISASNEKDRSYPIINVDNCLLLNCSDEKILLRSAVPGKKNRNALEAKRKALHRSIRINDDFWCSNIPPNDLSNEIFLLSTNKSNILTGMVEDMALKSDQSIECSSKSTSMNCIKSITSKEETKEIERYTSIITRQNGQSKLKNFDLFCLPTGIVSLSKNDASYQLATKPAFEHFKKIRDKTEKLFIDSDDIPVKEKGGQMYTIDLNNRTSGSIPTDSVGRINYCDSNKTNFVKLVNKEMNSSKNDFFSLKNTLLLSCLQINIVHNENGAVLKHAKPAIPHDLYKEKISSRFNRLPKVKSLGSDMSVLLNYTYAANDLESCHSFDLSIKKARTAVYTERHEGFPLNIQLGNGLISNNANIINHDTETGHFYDTNGTNKDKLVKNNFEKLSILFLKQNEECATNLSKTELLRKRIHFTREVKHNKGNKKEINLLTNGVIGFQYHEHVQNESDFSWEFPYRRYDAGSHIHKEFKWWEPDGGLARLNDIKIPLDHYYSHKTNENGKNSYSSTDSENSCSTSNNTSALQNIHSSSSSREVSFVAENIEMNFLTEPCSTIKCSKCLNVAHTEDCQWKHLFRFERLPLYFIPASTRDYICEACTPLLNFNRVDSHEILSTYDIIDIEPTTANSIVKYEESVENFDTETDWYQKDAVKPPPLTHIFEMVAKKSKRKRMQAKNDALQSIDMICRKNYDLIKISIQEIQYFSDVLRKYDTRENDVNSCNSDDKKVVNKIVGTYDCRDQILAMKECGEQESGYQSAESNISHDGDKEVDLSQDTACDTPNDKFADQTNCNGDEIEDSIQDVACDIPHHGENANNLGLMTTFCVLYEGNEDSIEDTDCHDPFIEDNVEDVGQICFVEDLSQDVTILNNTDDKNELNKVTSCDITDEINGLNQDAYVNTSNNGEDSSEVFNNAYKEDKEEDSSQETICAVSSNVDTTDELCLETTCTVSFEDEDILEDLSEDETCDVYGDEIADLIQDQNYDLFYRKVKKIRSRKVSNVFHNEDNVANLSQNTSLYTPSYLDDVEDLCQHATSSYLPHENKVISLSDNTNELDKATYVDVSYEADGEEGLSEDTGSNDSLPVADADELGENTSCKVEDLSQNAACDANKLDQVTSCDVTFEGDKYENLSQQTVCDTSNTNELDRVCNGSSEKNKVEYISQDTSRHTLYDSDNEEAESQDETCTLFSDDENAADALCRDTILNRSVSYKEDIAEDLSENETCDTYYHGDETVNLIHYSNHDSFHQKDEQIKARKVSEVAYNGDTSSQNAYSHVFSYADELENPSQHLTSIHSPHEDKVISSSDNTAFNAYYCRYKAMQSNPNIFDNLSNDVDNRVDSNLDTITNASNDTSKIIDFSQNSTSNQEKKHNTICNASYNGDKSPILSQHATLDTFYNGKKAEHLIQNTTSHNGNKTIHLNETTKQKIDYLYEISNDIIDRYTSRTKPSLPFLDIKPKESVQTVTKINDRFLNVEKSIVDRLSKCQKEIISTLIAHSSDANNEDIYVAKNAVKLLKSMVDKKTDIVGKLVKQNNDLVAEVKNKSEKLNEMKLKLGRNFNFLQSCMTNTDIVFDFDFDEKKRIVTKVNDQSSETTFEEDGNYLKSFCTKTIVTFGYIFVQYRSSLLMYIKDNEIKSSQVIERMDFETLKYHLSILELHVSNTSVEKQSVVLDSNISLVHTLSRCQKQMIHILSSNNNTNTTERRTSCFDQSDRNYAKKLLYLLVDKKLEIIDTLTIKNNELSEFLMRQSELLSQLDSELANSKELNRLSTTTFEEERPKMRKKLFSYSYNDTNNGDSKCTNNNASDNPCRTSHSPSTPSNDKHPQRLIDKKSVDFVVSKYSSKTENNCPHSPNEESQKVCKSNTGSNSILRTKIMKKSSGEISQATFKMHRKCQNISCKINIKDVIRHNECKDCQTWTSLASLSLASTLKQELTNTKPQLQRRRTLSSESRYSNCDLSVIEDRLSKFQKDMVKIISKNRKESTVK